MRLNLSIMKVKPLVFIITCQTLFSACGINKYTSTLEQMSTTETKNIVYTEQEIAEDIDYFIQAVEEVSPFPYMNADSLSVQALAIDMKTKGDRTGKELYLAFMELAAAFNVGHIYTFPPDKMLDEAVQNNDKFFPLFIELNDGRWEILGIIDNAIPEENIGDEVTKINGVEINEIVAKFLPLVADEADKEQTIGASLPFFLWAANINHPYTVEIVNNETGLSKIVELEGINDMAKYRNQEPKGAQEKLEDFVTFQILDSNIGYINAKSFYFAHKRVIAKAFEKELNSYFAELQEKGVANLIIDLRENGGGSSFPAETMLRKIANKPYQQTGGSIMRVSAQFREFIDDLPWALKVIVKRGMMKDYYQHPIGTNIREESEPALPKKVKNRFSGQVYVLIGPDTRSAAMMMANAVEDFDLGILVGEPTMSIPRELSNALPMKTPNAKISFTVPASLFTRANGDESNYNPVMPDIIIKTASEDIQNNLDRVMQYVLEKIAGN